jgi:glycosyltransferase involved in cell wall biosynthesis
VDNILAIGHIGRFVAQKNHTFLIDIYNEIHKKNDNAILLLAGQGPLQEAIKNKVHELGLESKVKFLGQINDTYKLYQALDIFILPSLYEGLPVVGVEAQATGLLCELSNDMTKETKVLDTTRFISLNTSAEEWATIILDDYSKFKRHDTTFEITKNSFNIKNETSKLENEYYLLLKENGENI